MSSFDDALSYYEDNEPRGEYVLVIKGKTFEEIEREKQQEFDAMTVEEHLNMYISQGIAKKDAIKMVAKDRGVSKRDIYNMTLNQED